MIPYIGEECAKTHTHGSHDNVRVLCPDCGKVKNKKMSIHTIYSFHSIFCSCGDGLSYPEKVVINILEQLELDFENHKTFEWSKNVQVNNPKLCGNKQYDFYLKCNNEEILIETHGEQHYLKSFYTTKKGRTLEEEQENDRIKKELVISNGIKLENYIVIDCRYSQLEWIKQNILDSKLSEIFDLSKIDWVQVGEFSLSNLVKIACDYKKNNPELTCSDIGSIMKINKNTIIRWLKSGSKLNWCYYNPKEEMQKSAKKNCVNKCKIIKVFKEDVFIYEFSSITELERQSFKILGIKITKYIISNILKKNIRYKGFSFKHVIYKKEVIN